ncbi:DUF6630 family protein [Vreelandella boliviensis]|uniref:DUF6630 domain-containing protein n=1 Tax=Vreelandella boliviensis LC1 TaxID=1072583 RepID=A0A265DX46_9GAMM|nr:hypothetical protein [Halomonas boliviensis]EHJ93286.1 hypothetical protein KUC_0233 [Halomonas boliviensis LC1]OZT73893.1 hypothetical protein CE457_12985 [Halomonas boliviensis LC1]
MAIVKKLLIIILVTAILPVVIPLAVYAVIQKRWFLSTLLLPLPEDVKSVKLDLLINSKKDVLQENIVLCLVDLNMGGYWLYFNIDWRAVEEVKTQGNALAKMHGVNDIFTSNKIDEEASVWSMLVVYDMWLQEKGYEVVLWDQGSDEYTGFICQLNATDKFLKAGKSLGLELVRLDHVNEQ